MYWVNVPDYENSPVSSSTSNLSLKLIGSHIFISAILRSALRGLSTALRFMKSLKTSGVAMYAPYTESEIREYIPSPVVYGNSGKRIACSVIGLGPN